MLPNAGVSVLIYRPEMFTETICSQKMLSNVAVVSCLFARFAWPFFLEVTYETWQTITKISKVFWK